MNVYGGHRQRGRKPFGGSAKHAAKRGRRFPDGQTMFGAEPRWACWRVDVDPRWPLFLSRDDLAAIRARWFDLADAEGVDPDRLKKGRGRLYELSSLIVADLIEAGAESKAIAAALGFSRQRVAERKAKAAELLGRPIVRPKIFGGAGSSFVSPARNSAFVRSK